MTDGKLRGLPLPVAKVAPRRALALALLTALLLAVLSFAAGCGEGEEPPEFVLGVIADLTGQSDARKDDGALPRLTADIAFYYGVQQAVNEAVAESAAARREDGEGDAAGLPIRLLTGDLAGDPGRTREVYSLLAREGADAILCPSRYAEEIADAAKTDGILLMAPDEGGMLAPVSYGEDGTLLSAQPGMVAGHTGFFTLRPGPVYYGRAAAFLMKVSSFRSAALVLNREDGYFLKAAEAFARAAEEYGLKLTARAEFSPGDAESVKAAAESVREAGGADGVFVACAFSQMKETVATALWQGGLYSGTPVFYADGGEYEPLLGAAKEGEEPGESSYTRAFLRQSVCLCVYNRRMKKVVNSPMAKYFREMYESDLTADAFWGYEGASVLLTAARSIGDGERKMLFERGLLSGPYFGINGSEFSFTEDGYAEKALSAVRFAEEEGALTDLLRIEGFRPK